MTVLATICASQAKGGAMKIVPAYGALRAKTVAFEQDKSERGHSGARPTARLLGLMLRKDAMHV